MNEQPSAFVSGFFTLLFVATFFYFLLTLPRKKFSDKFTVGYIEMPAPIQVTNNITNKTVKHVKKPIDKQLYDDCIEALRSLGHKKSYAAQKTKEIFNMFNPSSVQEFLSIVFKS
jgi:hypothetical protein